REVGDHVVDGGSREASARPGDRARGDVEGRDREAPAGELLRVVPEARAHHHRGPAAPGAGARAGPPQEGAPRGQARPRHAGGVGGGGAAVGGGEGRDGGGGGPAATPGGPRGREGPGPAPRGGPPAGGGGPPAPAGRGGPGGGAPATGTP